MSWIQTYTGRKVDPLNMKASDVCIEDIAHALAMKCRYSGHCPFFYSVAQHSVLVAQNCPIGTKLWGLLHDAAEAYLFDAARPVKQGFRDQYGPMLDEIEQSISAAVMMHFDLPIMEPKEVKVADKLLLTTEIKAMFGESAPYLDHKYRYENGWPMLSPAVLDGWTWQVAEDLFLRAYRQLSA